MSTIEVRPFRRSDREQLTDVINRHIQAVMPGITVSVNTVLNQLEREPMEGIEDPWVDERTTVVAEERQSLVAAAHLLRYADDDRVPERYRNAGMIRWLVAAAPLSPWTGSTPAADAVVAAGLAQFDGWKVAGRLADGSLPAPGVYGVPDAWPHVRSAYERAGFVHEGTIELILVACVDTLRPPPEPPVPGLVARRSIGINGTRFTAFLGDEQVGYIEVEIMAGTERLARFSEWADIGDLQVDEVYPRRDVATWLFGKVVEWLHLARIDRLLAYAWPEQSERLDLYRHLGFVELVRTARGWSAEPAH
ncbi:MAG: hypothetical protein ACRDP8_03795 [Actinopolymorphaceae bacterium]